VPSRIDATRWLSGSLHPVTVLKRAAEASYAGAKGTYKEFETGESVSYVQVINAAAQRMSAGGR